MTFPLVPARVLTAGVRRGRAAYLMHAAIMEGTLMNTPFATQSGLHPTHRVLPFLAVAGLLTAGCNGFNFSFTFIVPKKAEASDTQNVALPDGARVMVNNEVGSTRVTVDPNATQAKIEITRTALADTQEEADDLLTKIVVTITAPTAEDNTLKIDAPKPAEATGRSADFDVTVQDDEINVVAISATTLVAQVRLRITLPAGHGVDVVQGTGNIRAVALDTASSLKTTTGSVRTLGVNADVTIEVSTGGVDVEAHRGSLDVEIATGGFSAQIIGLADDDQVVARIETGGIELLLPEDISCVLKALVEVGAIEFRARDFDRVQITTQTRSVLDAKLGDGGPLVDLRSEVGGIDIDSQ